MKRYVTRNLTLSLPDELIRSAKVLAARRGTSVNTLVRESLEKLVHTEDRYRAAVERILKASARGLVAATLWAEYFSEKRGALSTQVLQEFFVTVTRKAARLPAAKAKVLLVNLLQVEVVTITGGHTLDAVEIHERWAFPSGTA